MTTCCTYLGAVSSTGARARAREALNTAHAFIQPRNSMCVGLCVGTGVVVQCVRGCDVWDVIRVSVGVWRFTVRVPAAVHHHCADSAAWLEIWK